MLFNQVQKNSTNIFQNEIMQMYQLWHTLTNQSITLEQKSVDFYLYHSRQFKQNTGNLTEKLSITENDAKLSKTRRA